MVPIMVEQGPSEERRARLGVVDWPVLCCDVSGFSTTYDQREVCYLLEGEALVTPDDDGAPIEIASGDLVVFPAGLTCRWEVLTPIRKQYRLG